MNSPTNPSPKNIRAYLRIDFWSIIMGIALLIIGLMLVWPIAQVLLMGVFDSATHDVTLAHYKKILTHPYYVGALWNTMIVGLGGMLGACLLGVPLAYCTARYVIKGRSIIATLAVMALVSPPFIGAYSWIVVLGNNGWLTLQLKSLGINMPTIYGVSGIILVFSLKFFPFVYLMTESALRNINRSYEEAAENLGCTSGTTLLPGHFAARVSRHKFGRHSLFCPLDRRLRHSVDHRARLPYLVDDRLQPVHLGNGRNTHDGSQYLDAHGGDFDAGRLLATSRHRQAQLFRVDDQPPCSKRGQRTRRFRCPRALVRHCFFF